MGVNVHLYICLLCFFACHSIDAVIDCSSNPKCNCTRLQDNSLKLNCSGLQLYGCPHIYDNVTIADLSWNMITAFNKGVFPSSLNHLDISHNHILTVDFISWRNLSQLESLNISFNKIKYLDESSFRNRSYLRHLDISNCDLYDIMNGTFRPLTQLLHLNISYNRFLTFKVLENVTYDLQFTKVKVFDISMLHCTFGPGIVIYQEDFKHLRKTNLQTLYMNSNRISEFERHTLKFLPPTLEKIFVRDNDLSMGQYVLEITFLRGLKLLDGSFQYMIHIPATYHNEYRSCNDWRPPPRGSGFPIDLHAQQIRSFGNFSSGSLKINIPLPLPHNLENVSFIGCGVRNVIREVLFSPENSIKRIDLRDNVFYSWEGPVHNLHQLEFLDLSNNFCSNMSEFFLSDAPNLISLNIGNNLLGFVLHKVKPFEHLHSLKTLNLSSNRIDYLQDDIFAHTTNLSILNLGSNIMKAWNFTIKHMKKLQYIDLSNNNIQSISTNVRQEITQAAKNRTLLINLENNPMRCECSDSFQEQLKWMITIHMTHKIFIGFENYTCFWILPTGKFYYVHFNDKEEVQKFELNCNNYAAMIVGVLGAIVVCVSVLLCGLIYRFRWKLRYLFYMQKNKYLGHVNPERGDRTYMFDAFVSYSEEESVFIRTSFLKEIETKRNFTCCIHQRDFVAGKDVAENITNAIHRSRVTIAIITESYLKSYWCMFEFNMARMESIYARDGDNTIFLIMLKPVPIKTLPLHMLDVINNKTYIEYPEEEIDGNVVFWDSVTRGITY